MLIIFLQCRDLKKYYRVNRGRKAEVLKALDGAALSLSGNESVGIVGESGCGKSTLLRLLLRLEEPTAGEVVFRGQSLNSCPGKKLLFYRREVQSVFQDAAASINPRMTAGQAIAEPLLNIADKLNGAALKARVKEAMAQVGLNPGSSNRYPHEFSGGQQRRIALARAIIARPRLIICDEATSGLDVSVQAQLLNLLQDIRRDNGVQYLFVTHDLAAVRYLCSRLVVMYGGQVVEELPAALLSQALHPYTRALAFSEPDLLNVKNPVVLEGEPPDPAAFPTGCRFYPRCPESLERCSSEVPLLKKVQTGRLAACWRHI